MVRWLGLNDRGAAATLIGSIVFIVLLLGALPRWLHGREAEDYRGVAAQTAPGIVSTVTISPISRGGGGLFNGVNVTFAGHRVYYALPPESQWKPDYGQRVMVTYRVGRQSGIVRVDDVTPENTPSVSAKRSSGRTGP
ncbi:MAG: hypothetical protein JO250_09930 [Armatimonadetes bacterium]|nr:hypothetical protein [Armatimonadota bacterium]